jgi:hypothetical protein
MSDIITSNTSESTEKRDTIGAISSELLSKESPTNDPIELEREMHKDYEANVYECVERGKKEFFGDFYVVVTTKKERLMQNVLRNYFFPRNSCPTPEWDQAVYFYSRKDEKIDFMWVIPSKDTCKLFKENALLIAPEEKELLQFILEFEDGTLLEKSRLLNGENPNDAWTSTVILQK